IERLLAQKRPNVVFHLAAYKHVPLGEQGADELVSVNVLGTDSLAQACTAAGVQHFVYPSSDKAINPPSAYGSTKRLAETLLLAIAAARDTMALHVARYVNILGSAGSVSETVAVQARARQPVTLTDARMTRYWMSMDEAIDLAWHSLGLENGSRTILDVGEPVPVMLMAERLYRMASPDGVGPEFLVTGVRPGERLAEEMASASETLERRGDDPVLSVRCGRLADQFGVISAALPELRRLLSCGDGPALHRLATELARQLQ
ncbi:MAG: polysaccharide biosynthesis protein, partial [Chloroflexi bacterium]|nr:polysaccharide biosynthesis protein [Chloroflexota bacterium]